MCFFSVSSLIWLPSTLIANIIFILLQESRNLNDLNKELEHKLSTAISENVLLNERCEKFGFEFAQYETKLEKLSKVCACSSSTL